MLHTPFYDVRTRAFCGPTAMSAVTGRPISEIRELLRAFRPRKNGRAPAIRGVSNPDMINAMRQLGWKVLEHRHDYPYEQTTPYRFKDFLRDHGNDGPFIVNVTHHYLAVSHGEVCDTATCLPTSVERYLKRRHGPKRLIEHWWKFVPRDGTLPPSA